MMKLVFFYTKWSIENNSFIFLVILEIMACNTFSVISCISVILIKESSRYLYNTLIPVISSDNDLCDNRSESCALPFGLCAVTPERIPVTRDCHRLPLE